MKKFTSSKVLALFLSLAVIVSCFAIYSSRRENNVYGAIAKNNQYSLAGAQYQLYTDSNCSTKAKDANGNNAILTTDASGNVSALEIEAGTYYAKEVTASPGYLLDETVQTLNVTSGGTANFTSTEMPTIGRMMKLQKYDKNGEYGWRKLLGAEYTLNYYDVDPSTEDVSGMTPLRTWKFKTVEKTNSQGHKYAGIDFATDEPLEGSDGFYVAKVQAYQSNGRPLALDNENFDTLFHHYKLDNDGTSTRILPIGVFTIEETKAPQGVARNTTVYYGSVTQSTAGADAITEIRGTTDFVVNVHTGAIDNAEDDQKVEIAIEKVAAQTGNNVPQGSEASAPDTRKGVYSTLEGAEFNVYYDNATGAEPELVGTITTDANGKGKLTKRTLGDQAYIDQDLRPGTYIIEETKAPAGFLIDKYILKDDGSTGEFSGDIEAVCEYEVDNTQTTKNVSGTYSDGQRKIVARAQANDSSVFTYTLTSLEAETETHIKKTDATTTKELPGAKLQIYALKDNSLVEEWISTNEEHIVYGLPTGKYLLREITSPSGYDVAEDIEFTVKNDEVVTKVEMKNKLVEIGTTATDKDTESHQGTFKETEGISDKVALKGLNEGWTYKVDGVLMDKATGEALKDADGHKITATTGEFTATGDEMEVELKFSVDSSKFTTDKVAVVFEKLYRTKPVPTAEGHPERPEEELPKEVAKHEDINDENQSIHYGGIIKTEALDNLSASHSMAPKDPSCIIDKVYYGNLSTEETYTCEGEVYDKTLGKLTGIKAKATFKPTTPSGYVELKFIFDGSSLAGHTLVCFEELSINGTKVNEHKDPNDEDQSVHVSEIKTKIGERDGDYIIDTVTYRNLIPNKSYVMRGYFVGRLTGFKVDGSDGYIQFTPKTPDGSIQVKLKNVEGSGNVVAFEECYIINDAGKEGLVGYHKDLKDKDQFYNKTGKIVVDDKDSFKKVQTGDHTMITLWIAIFITALALFTVLAVLYVKKRKDEDRSPLV